MTIFKYPCIQSASAALLWVGAAIATATATATAVAAESAPRIGHLKLVDSFDRPQDGYCLDVVGSGRYIRFDLPLTAHNCKPGLYDDEAVSIEPNGQIRFPAYNACATVAGLNGRALPGAAVVPRACDERTPFMDAEKLQRFTFRDDGRIELKDSGLCLTVGAQSDSTFDDTHRWRTLYVDSCNQTVPVRSQWHHVVPKVNP